MDSWANNLTVPFLFSLPNKFDYPGDLFKISTSDCNIFPPDSFLTTLPHPQISALIWHVKAIMSDGTNDQTCDLWYLSLGFKSTDGTFTVRGDADTLQCALTWTDKYSCPGIDTQISYDTIEFSSLAGGNVCGCSLSCVKPIAFLVPVIVLYTAQIEGDMKDPSRCVKRFELPSCWKVLFI